MPILQPMTIDFVDLIQSLAIIVMALGFILHVLYHKNLNRMRAIELHRMVKTVAVTEMVKEFVKSIFGSNSWNEYITNKDVNNEKEKK